MTQSHQALFSLTALLRARFPDHHGFNVFDALRLAHDEVRLHSRLIAFLIDPHAHAHGAALLYRFMCCVGIVPDSEEECRYARVATEEGHVDIVIEFGRKRVVVIENKIHAPDQERQLYRYWDRTRRHHDDVHLLYLTLQGERPFDASLCALDELMLERYQNVSYKHHIRTWLLQAEACAAQAPHLRDTIAQYARGVDRLTGHLETGEYMNELVDVLLKGEHLRHARDIRAAYTRALVVLQGRMWDALWAVAQRDYPDMAERLTPQSLPAEPSARRERIERFYQLNARKRDYFGLYFRIPGFSEALGVIEIEIEAGLYTGILCPPHDKSERTRAIALLEEAGIHGESQPTWAMWRRCALSGDLLDPDDVTLALLSDAEALRQAAESSVAQVYSAWSVLSDSAARQGRG
ncbi:PD-(D/E)XK nuclease family protein [Massilia sp. H6]|uniref:PDDEXK-like family protein n=1 Tax=Massilia sp. H6 TaxID=2970464 RepID=UPI00216A1919|nr:PD-(D/E)XK nuclease family protein [Massilia sp. H6]UVW30718.1 PD-(D/E)XK nuclease family protein [Massilia sp. H6]